MNALGSTYIPDKLAAYQVKMRAGWNLTCVERKVADSREGAAK